MVLEFEKVQIKLSLKLTLKNVCQMLINFQ